MISNVIPYLVSFPSHLGMCIGRTKYNIPFSVRNDTYLFVIPPAKLSNRDAKSIRRNKILFLIEFSVETRTYQKQMLLYAPVDDNYSPYTMVL